MPLNTSDLKNQVIVIMPFSETLNPLFIYVCAPLSVQEDVE